MAEFLAIDALFFDDIRAVLDQHFAPIRSGATDSLLAGHRAVITPLATLRSNLLKPPLQRVLLNLAQPATPFVG
ncbi:MAG: hypothetical protein R2932_60215 [Caldilineaceae bacterium]